MPKFNEDDKQLKALHEAMEHHRTCSKCQQSYSYAKIGLGCAGCSIGQELWRISMLEFIRLNPQYKADFEAKQKGMAN